MITIGLLTCQRLPELADADRTLIPLFQKHDIIAEAVIWNDPSIVWTKYDALVIRNTWDYYTQSEAFVLWLKSIRTQNIPLINPVDIVLTNLHKFYLRDFQSSGVTIIPTLFVDKRMPLSFDTLLQQGWTKIVFKPAISAGSYLTQTFSTAELTPEKLSSIIQGNDWLIQPFLPEIEQGELSMIFFSGEFSHAVVKKPKAGDFRVQKQYGGLYQLFDPGKDLLETAQKIIAQVGQSLPYARVDGVLIDGTFHLMELELIEPDLYFDLDERAKQRFVDAVVLLVNR